MRLEERSRGMKPFSFWAMSAGLALMLIAGACASPHYSVSVARGKNHVTFAQRHHEARHNDYLVDCKMAENGALTDCYIIELKGE
jgi:hypothetical protein